MTLGAGDDAPVSGQKLSGNGADTISGGDGNDTITDAGGDNPLITGGTGGDTITVDGGNNAEIDGDAGDDVITTGAGNDFVYGGHKDQPASTVDGSDTINTAAGNDYVVGGSGADFMNVAGGTDTISYEEKSDPVWAVVVPSGGQTGGSGTFCNPYSTPAGTTCEGDTVIDAENLRGGSGADVLAGDQLDLVGGVLKCKDPTSNSLVNELRGGAGNDQLFGCVGNDTLFGDAGDDTLVGGAGSDDINGGDLGEVEGDSVSYQDYVPASGDKGVTVTLGDGAFNDGPTDGPATELDNLHGDIENVTGSDYKDVLVGSGNDNKLRGLGGNDLLDGGFGADTLVGGADTDTVTYNGVLVGTTQVTSARTTAIVANLDGVANDGQANENDNIDPTVENVTGGSGDDTFVGQPIGSAINGAADNVFIGNDGKDSFDGKYGADTFTGGAGEDTVLYTGRTATEVVTAQIDGLPHSGSVNDRNTAGQLDKLGTDIENITGGDEPDVFTGDQKANILKGAGGADQIDGQAGDDRIEGGAGNDNIDGGAGIDSLQGGLGDDVIAGSGGTDTVDYTERSTPVAVSLDNLANDGEIAIAEKDNVLSDIEVCAGCTTVTGDGLQGGGGGAGGAGGGGGVPAADDTTPADDTPPADDTTPAQDTTTPATTSNNQGSSTTTTKVDAATEEKGTTSGSSSKQQTLVSLKKTKLRANKILVRGRILVKARKGKAKASAACKGGGNVRVIIRKGGKVVGKRLVKMGRTCGFKAPVKLKRGVTGTVKVQVRFLGNSKLKATKRTTKLQVNG